MLFAAQTGYLSKLYGVERAVDMLIEAGYPAIDVTMFNAGSIPFCDDYMEIGKTIKQKAEAGGVKLIQSHAPFVGGNYDRYVKESMPFLPRAIELSGFLGIPNVVIHPIQRGRYYGHEQELFDMNVEFYRSLAPLAHEHGVKIAMENMWQSHPVTRNICDDVLAPAEEMVRMYDTLDDPEAFTICLDLGHAALCGREPEDMIRTIGHDRLGCIHAHDVDYRVDLHTLPGISKLNWKNICQALADIDYQGCFTLEADNFFLGYDEEQLPIATKFMADIARTFADRIDALRK